MYNSLVATCRCGRKKTEGHMIKCLQKVKNIYLSDDEDEKKNHRIETPLPRTSSGWFYFLSYFLLFIYFFIFYFYL